MLLVRSEAFWTAQAPGVVTQDQRIGAISGDVSSHSIAITLGAGVNCVVFKATYYDTAVINTVKVGVAGPDLARVGPVANQEDRKAEIWQLTAAGLPTTPTTIEVAKSAASKIVYEVVALKGVNLSSPVMDNDTNAADSVETISASLTSTGNAWMECASVAGGTGVNIVPLAPASVQQTTDARPTTPDTSSGQGYDPNVPSGGFTVTCGAAPHNRKRTISAMLLKPGT